MTTNNSWNSNDPVQVGLGGSGQSTLTTNGVLVGNASSPIISTAEGATNTALLGSTGNPPVFGQIPNAVLLNSTITLTSGNNITVSGSPISLGGVANVAVTGTTNHAIQLGNSSGSLTSLSSGGIANVLLAQGLTVNPVWVAPSAFNGLQYSSGSGMTLAYGLIVPVDVTLGGTGTITNTQNGVLYGNDVSPIGATSAGTTNTVLLGNTGSAPTFGTVPNSALTNHSVTINNGSNITWTANTINLGDTVTANLSGTTNHSVQVGNSGGSLTSVAVGTNGQVLLAATSGDPTWRTPTVGSGLAVTSSATTLSYGLITPIAVSNGGTGTGTTFTQGSVVFAGSAGAYSQDNTHLFYDSGNGRLGINTGSPARSLDIRGDQQTIGSLFVADANGSSNYITMRWGSGTGIFQNNAGNMQFYTPASTTHLFIVDATPELTITTNAVHINGALSKGSGTFLIDHPLDPVNKNLMHSFIESPDMMNIYNGNVVLDEMGQAIITMPDWFDALNIDFKYQLTCIGSFAPVYVLQEWNGTDFRIAGGSLGTKVSWQITGIRNDRFAQKYRVQVEETKKKEGYIHPELWN